jgi:hypothetical protein
MHTAARTRWCWMTTAVQCDGLDTLSSLSKVPGCRAWKWRHRTLRSMRHDASEGDTGGEESLEL